MTGFAHRLLGHDDLAGTIRPVVTSLYEPAPATPGELDVFEEATEFGTAPEPARPAASPAAGARAAQAIAGSGPVPAAGPSLTDMLAATRSQTGPPPAGPVPSPAAGPSAPGRRAHQAHAPEGQAHQRQAQQGHAPEGQLRPPLVPAIAVPEVAAAPLSRASERDRRAGPLLPRPPSRQPPLIAQLRETAELTIPASHQVPAAGTAPPPYPAFPAARGPMPGAMPALTAGRPGSPAISRQGNHPHPGPGQPDVHITIGRIDVRAVPEPPRSTGKEPRRPGAPTLQDYLRSRDGRA